jgi:Transposase DDE domain
MCASLETLVIAAYVFADSLSFPRPGPPGKVTDQELIALAVAQAVTGICSDRQFLGVIGRLLPGFFPGLPGQSQYNRRLRRLTPWITTVQMMVAELIADGEVRLVDGTLIACANYPGCRSLSEFAGHASYGYCPSKSLFVWGMRLVLISDAKGVPVGYDLTGPKIGQERERALELAAAHPGSTLFADKGFWGKEYQDCMELIDIQLITPERHHPGPRPAAEILKARVRLVIESVFSNLKRQMRRRARAARRTTTPRSHPRNAPQHPHRAPTPSPRRLRRPVKPTSSL